MTPVDWKRKAVHAGMGLFAPALAFLDWRGAGLLAGAALLFNLFAMPRIGRGIYRDPAAARDAGIVSYAAAVLALVLLYRHRLEIAAAVWGMLAFGDPAAAIAGGAFPGNGLPWNREKSWAGLLANFGASAVAGLLLFRFVAHAPVPGALSAVLAGAAAFAFLESLSTGIEDNLVAPLPASLVVWGWLAAGPHAGRLLADFPGFAANAAVAIAVNAVAALAMSGLRLVSRSGAAAGFVVGTLVLGLGGFGAYLLLWAFFALGTAATKLGYAAKVSRGTEQGEGGRRGARHVLANCGVAAAILLVAAGGRPSLPDAVAAAFAGAFAAALADTLGTEVGSLAGRTPFSPLQGGRVPPGTPGAVSWQGTLAGAAGALAIAGIGFAAGLVPGGLVWAVAAGGVFGSLAESCLADLGRLRGFRLDHEFANALCTFAGAAMAAEIALSVAKGAVYLPLEN
ncbi:MAG TPA: DUF92 domain-containing protein [Thermoanaerobaculia bacterium]|nr:DUF92 domain-containing protein [Thermoanaerobaculia bacterium]